MQAVTIGFSFKFTLQLKLRTTQKMEQQLSSQRLNDTTKKPSLQWSSSTGSKS